MRFGIATSLVLVSLASAGASDAYAQVTDISGVGVSLDCPSDPVATAVDGGSLGAADVIPPGTEATPGHLPPREHDLAPAWCRDSSDPRCAPLTPTQQSSSFHAASQLPRWLPTAFAIVHRVSVNVRPSHAWTRIERTIGADGFARSLDRPPRAR